MKRAIVMASIYISLFCILAINIKMYYDAEKVREIARVNSEQINILSTNDSLFLIIAKKSMESDSLRLEWVKENNTILQENNRLIHKILKLLHDDTEG